MTTSHLPITGPWGKRIELRPDAPIRITEAGRIAVPVRLNNGAASAVEEDLVLVVTVEQALGVSGDIARLLPGAAEAS